MKIDDNDSIEATHEDYELQLCSSDILIFTRNKVKNMFNSKQYKKICAFVRLLFNQQHQFVCPYQSFLINYDGISFNQVQVVVNVDIM